ncbi:MAG: SWIM zinc finger family protein [Micromonosporaceae bacterium]
MADRNEPWWHEGPSRPRDVDGGIKARSRRGSIGEQWWSRRFIEVLESFGMHGRLARGRNYARRGLIVEFTLETGVVTARVQGSRPNPYRVRIKVLPLTTKQWRQVEQALAGQALFRAKLLAGEMPQEIERVFADCGTALFPRSLRDLEMSCSCPDWEVPCKHLAATLYVLAEKFDDDPFLVLAWRGKRRGELLDRLRQLTAATAQASGSRVSPGPAEITGSDVAPPASVTAVLGDVAGPPLADCLDGYWSPGMSLARLRARPVTPATAPDLLLRSVEPPRIEVRGRDLAELLAPAYVRMAGGQRD